MVNEMRLAIALGTAQYHRSQLRQRPNALSKVLEVFQILQPARSRSVVEETSGLWIWSYADYPAIKIKLP